MTTRLYLVWAICGAVVFQLSLILTMPLAAQQAEEPEENRGAEAFELMDTLKDEVADERVRRLVVEGLTEIGEGAEPALRDALDHWDSRVQRTAVEVLENIGTKGIPDLVLALSNKNLLTRVAASRALADMGEATLPFLHSALKKPEEVFTNRPQHMSWVERLRGDSGGSYVATHGVITAGRFGYIPDLHLRYEYEKAKLRLEIVKTVGDTVKDIAAYDSYDPKPPPEFDPALIATMMEGFSDPDKRVRFASADAIAEFGAPAAAALLDTMKKPNPAIVYSAAVRALAKIGGTPLSSDLKPAKDVPPTAEEVKHIEAHKAAVTDAAWGMDEALRGASLSLQMTAANALSEFDCEYIEPDAAVQVVSTLEEWLKDSRRRPRLLAVRAIRKIGEAAVDENLKGVVKTAIDTAKNSDDVIVRRAATVETLEVGEDAPIEE